MKRTSEKEKGKDSEDEEVKGKGKLEAGKDKDTCPGPCRTEFTLDLECRGV